MKSKGVSKTTWLIIIAVIIILLGSLIIIRSQSKEKPNPQLDPTPDPTPDPEPTSCLDSENNLRTKLASLDTSTDFTFYLETEDGNKFIYSRGQSTLNTPYDSASSSKWVTATIILRLVDADYLSLDDHPQDYITNWPIPNEDPLYDMTLRDLLSFTSGLEDPKTALACVDFPRQDFEDCIKSIATQNIGKQNNPGDGFYYDSYHLQTAGLMAIKARGVDSWQDIFSEFQTQTGLFGNSAYDLPSTTNPRLAGGMTYIGQDYIDFLREYYAGNLLNADTLNKQTIDQTKSSTIKASPAKEGINKDWHYGLGLWIECDSELFNCGDEVTRISSPGAYGTYPFIDYEQNFFGILARQGSLGSFREGYAIYDSVASEVNSWVRCVSEN